MTVSSLLNYVGHKSKIWNQIKPHLPLNIDGTFWELFSGSCVIGMNVPYKDIRCVEYNPNLSGLYRDLTNPQFKPTLLNLINLYGFTNSSRTPRSQYLVDSSGQQHRHLMWYNDRAYTQLLEDFNNDKFSGIEKSAAYMIATIYGRNSGVATNLEGKLSGAVGPLDFSVRCEEKLDLHYSILQEGRHQFICDSYQNIAPEPQDFVYMDPPYLASNFNYTRVWTATDEQQLLDYIQKLPCDWALSNTLQSGNKVNQILLNWIIRNNYTVVPIEKQYRKWAWYDSGKSSDREWKINGEILVLKNPPCPSNSLGGNVLWDYSTIDASLLRVD